MIRLSIFRRAVSDRWRGLESGSQTSLVLGRIEACMDLHADANRAGFDGRMRAFLHKHQTARILGQTKCGVSSRDAYTTEKVYWAGRWCAGSLDALRVPTPDLTKGAA